MTRPSPPESACCPDAASAEHAPHHPGCARWSRADTEWCCDEQARGAGIEPADAAWQRTHEALGHPPDPPTLAPLRVALADLRTAESAYIDDREHMRGHAGQRAIDRMSEARVAYRRAERAHRVAMEGRA